jgi:hypothetical protein
VLAPLAPLVEPVLQAQAGAVGRVLVTGPSDSAHKGVDELTGEVLLGLDTGRAVLRGQPLAALTSTPSRPRSSEVTEKGVTDSASTCA